MRRSVMPALLMARQNLIDGSLQVLEIGDSADALFRARRPYPTTATLMVLVVQFTMVDGLSLDSRRLWEAEICRDGPYR